MPPYRRVLSLDGGGIRGLIPAKILQHVDGRVFANNPSMIALSETLSSGANTENILLCSIGTGTNTRKIPYEEAKDWGLAGWPIPVLSVMMDGMSDSADYHVR